MGSEANGVRLVKIDRLSGFIDIEVRIPPEPPGPRPVVVSFTPDATDALLAHGLAVVGYRMHWELIKGIPPPAPPPPPPGAKPAGVWMLASPTSETVGKGYLQIIEGNARGTLPKVLDAVAAIPEVDTRHVGVVGHSTNALLAMRAAVDPRVAAVVAIAGCGDYRCFLHRSTLAMNGKPLGLAPDYERWIEEHEPVAHPRELTHAAILMLNGRSDLAMPFRCAELTAEAFAAAYRAAGVPDRFRFLAIDAGHSITEAARDDALAWLTRWLVPGPERGRTTDRRGTRR